MLVIISFEVLIRQRNEQNIMCSIEHVANLSKIKDTFYPPR